MEGMLVELQVNIGQQGCCLHSTNRRLDDGGILVTRVKDAQAGLVTLERTGIDPKGRDVPEIDSPHCIPDYWDGVGQGGATVGDDESVITSRFLGWPEEPDSRYQRHQGIEERRQCHHAHSGILVDIMSSYRNKCCGTLKS